MPLALPTFFGQISLSDAGAQRLPHLDTGEVPAGGRAAREGTGHLGLEG